MVHFHRPDFVRRGTKKSGNGEAGSKKLFPGFILTEMLKTFSFTGMNKTLNNEPVYHAREPAQCLRLSASNRIIFANKFALYHMINILKQRYQTPMPQRGMGELARLVDSIAQ